MKKQLQRRSFLKYSGLGMMPLLAPASMLKAAAPNASPEVADNRTVNFISAGEMLEPQDYIQKLLEISKKSGIEQDSFAAGGCVTALEKKFEELTGMEKAVFVPTGTMANQLAISLLSGDRAKVIVQETSHVYRDEADAAQSVHGKRLVPLAKDSAFFTAKELDEQIRNFKDREYFASPVGAISLETPVRRTDNTMIPFSELQAISNYCREKNIPLHLDGARIFMAATWSNHSVKEYAALADTLYISLYKYLGASSGAILCGKKALIEKIPHLIKIHGGSMYRNWPNAAMALDHIDSFAERLQAARQKGEQLISLLNKLNGLHITPHTNGTNQYKMELSIKNPGAFRDALTKAGIRAGQTMFSINETILYWSNDDLLKAFKTALAAAS